MKDSKDKTVLEDILDNFLEGESRRNDILVIGVSVVVFIFTWIIAALILFICTIPFPFLNDCQTFSYTNSTQCTTKGWVSFIINIVSFIKAALYLASPKFT